MSNYTKFSLKTFKEKLEAGEYKGLTGANRAIGKTKELSDKEKEKAKAMALEFFGEDRGAAKPAKAAKAPKAAKKAAKKAAPKLVRVPRAPKAAKPTAAKAAPAKRGKKAKKSTGRQPRTAPSEAAPVQTKVRTPSHNGVIQTPAEPVSEAAGEQQRVVMFGGVIGSIDQALRSMQYAKELLGKGDVGPATGVEMDKFIGDAVGMMARAVQAMDRTVVSPHLGTPTRQPSTKGRASVPPVEEPSEESAPDEEAFAEGTVPVPRNGLKELTPEEQEQLELARSTQNVALAKAGLRGVPEPPAD